MIELLPPLAVPHPFQSEEEHLNGESQEDADAQDTTPS